MNTAVDPCVDFYQYACGNWMAHNPIPADRSRWGRFAELSERNEKVLLDIVEGAAVDKPGRSATDQKIGDYYASCMDETAIEKKGWTRLRRSWSASPGCKAKRSCRHTWLTLINIGSNAFFEFSSQPDFKNATMEIAETDQSGLGLPDRDYYLKTDPRSVALQAEIPSARAANI